MAQIGSQTKTFALCLLFFVLVALTTLRTVCVYHVPVPKETIRFGHCDFHNAVYFPGLAFARGENPYSSRYAANYPVNREMSPYAPMLLPFGSAFGLLPLRVADVVWYSVNLCLVLMLAAKSLQVAGFRLNVQRVALVGSLVLLSRVGQSNQILGQMGVFFAMFTLFAVGYARTHFWLSAVGTALASLKPTFGIPLVLMMLAGRKIRPALMGTFVVALGSALSLSWILLHQRSDLLSSFNESQEAIIADSDVDPDSAWMRTDLPSVIARNLSIQSDITGELVGMMIILFPACLALWKLSSERDCEETRSLELAVVSSAIPLCIYHLSYDLLVLLPAILVAIRGRLFASQSRATVLQFIYITLVLIPMMNYIASYSVMERFGIVGVVRELAISLNAASLLAANVVLWLAVRSYKGM